MQDNKLLLRTALWMLAGVVGFSTMAIAGRELSDGLDTFEVMFWRSCVSIIAVLTLSTATGTRNQINTDKLGLHALRNLSHFTGQNMWLFALGVSPLAQVISLEFSMPIWALLMATVILGEKLTRARTAAAIIGFIGVLIIAQPKWGEVDAGVLAASGAAIGFAASAIFTRRLTRTAGTVCILFWLSVMQMVMGLLCAGADLDIALPSANNWVWLVVISLAGLFAHFCLTTALKIAPAAIAIPFDFLRLPLIAVLGMLLYDEPFRASVLIGAAVIFGANYLNILVESRRKA